MTHNYIGELNNFIARNHGKYSLPTVVIKNAGPPHIPAFYGTITFLNGDEEIRETTCVNYTKKKDCEQALHKAVLDRLKEKVYDTNYKDTHNDYFRYHSSVNCNSTDKTKFGSPIRGDEVILQTLEQSTFQDLNPKEVQKPEVSSKTLNTEGIHIFYSSDVSTFESFVRRFFPNLRVLTTNSPNKGCDYILFGYPTWFSPSCIRECRLFMFFQTGTPSTILIKSAVSLNGFPTEKKK